MKGIALHGVQENVCMGNRVLSVLQNCAVMRGAAICASLLFIPAFVYGFEYLWGLFFAMILACYFRRRLIQIHEDCIGKGELASLASDVRKGLFAPGLVCGFEYPRSIIFAAALLYGTRRRLINMPEKRIKGIERAFVSGHARKRLIGLVIESVLITVVPQIITASLFDSGVLSRKVLHHGVLGYDPEYYGITMYFFKTDAVSSYKNLLMSVAYTESFFVGLYLLLFTSFPLWRVLRDIVPIQSLTLTPDKEERKKQQKLRAKYAYWLKNCGFLSISFFLMIVVPLHSFYKDEFFYMYDLEMKVNFTLWLVLCTTQAYVVVILWLFALVGASPFRYVSKK